MNNEYIEQYSDINVEGVELYVKDTADGIIILRIANNEQKVKVTCGDLVKEYSLSELTLQDA